MLTPEQRRKLEAEWSSDDQSLVSIARLMKAAVLALFVLGLAVIGAGGDKMNDAQQASAATPVLASTNTAGR